MILLIPPAMPNHNFYCSILLCAATYIEHGVPNNMPFTLDDVMKMRGNSLHFEMIYKTFLARVHGKGAFDKRAKTTLISEFVTVSTEALMILLFVNHWDQWMAQAENERRKAFPQEDTIVVPQPKWTQPNGGKNLGMSTAGKEFFNNQCLSIKEDRQENPIAETLLLASLQEAQQTSSKKTRFDEGQDLVMYTD